MYSCDFYIPKLVFMLIKYYIGMTFAISFLAEFPVRLQSQNKDPLCATILTFLI
jgi:hypothetical protein